MRLSQWQRDKIVDAAERAAFATRDKEREERGKDLALRVRNYLMTEDQQKAVDALPAKFFGTGGYCYAKKDEEGSKDYVQLTFPSDLAVPDFIASSTHIVPDEIWNELQAWIDSNKALGQDKADFRARTKGVVNAFSSAKKLLAEWPTLRDLMPAGFFDEKKAVNVPAHNTIAQLDAALQAGRPFDAELAAAA